jgi:hypothetical protein
MVEKIPISIGLKLKKIKVRVSKKLFKESINVLKALKSTDIDLDEIQIYLSTEEGTILEFCLGFDEDGELRKTMDTHDSADEMHEQREEEENEFCENILLN